MTELSDTINLRSYRTFRILIYVVMADIRDFGEGYG